MHQLTSPDRLVVDEEYREMLRVLSDGSVHVHFDPYEDIAWDAPEMAIDQDDPRWVLSSESDPLGATAWYQALPLERQVEIGKWRLMNTMKVGAAFESMLIRGLMQYAVALPNRSPEFRYCIHEMTEECNHIQMFMELLNRVGADVPGMRKRLRVASPFIGGALAFTPVLLMIAILAGEEPIDHHQKSLMREGGHLPPAVLRTMEIHIAEEARHISFANEFVKLRVPRMSRPRRAAVSVLFPVLMRVAAEEIMTPPGAVAKRMGIPRDVFRDAFWASPRSRELMASYFSDMRALAEETGLMNGAAHAHLDRVPLVIISDRYTESELTATSGHQILDQRALLDPLVRFNATVEPATAGASIRAALERASAAPAGPVHLDMPRDVAARPAPDGTIVRSQPAPDAAGLDVPDVVIGARRPALVIGLEANDPAIPPGAIEALADELGAAVLTTYKAKGVVTERHPRWAGIVTGGDVERAVLDEADAIVVLGLDPVELLTKAWPFATPVLNLRGSDAQPDYLPIHSTGPLATALAALRESLAERRTATGWAPGELAALRDATLTRLRVGEPDALTQWRAVEAIQNRTGDDVNIAVDAGAHMFAATNFWRSTAPRRFLISNGLATMGFAVPSAIGAALADPGRHAIAITGDGGMAYHAFELTIAQRDQLPVIVVVLNDSSLSLIRIKHEAKGHPRDDLDLDPVSFAEVASGLGVRGLRAASLQELGAALDTALAAAGPTVVDLELSGDEQADMLRAVRG